MVYLFSGLHSLTNNYNSILPQLYTIYYWHKIFVRRSLSLITRPTNTMSFALSHEQRALPLPTSPLQTSQRPPPPAGDLLRPALGCRQHALLLILIVIIIIVAILVVGGGEGFLDGGAGTDAGSVGLFVGRARYEHHRLRVQGSRAIVVDVQVLPVLTRALGALLVDDHGFGLHVLHGIVLVFLLFVCGRGGHEFLRGGRLLVRRVRYPRSSPLGIPRHRLAQRVLLPVIVFYPPRP
mmetsp:Transcript_11734/g.28826  ORF Transcript_11734/g.28826 Transcript_11734/m.28826 type:complete len:237 (+) Transcript_11734:23-733(+)